MGSYRDLDSFTAAMFEAALFAETDGDDPLDKNYGIEDFAKPTFDALVAEAAQFQDENPEDIIRGGGARLERAGHDFWLTRNGHGAGFWDGDWPEGVGERLTAASEAFGQVDLYVHRGKIYGSGYEKAVRKRKRA